MVDAGSLSDHDMVSFQFAGRSLSTIACYINMADTQGAIKLGREQRSNVNPSGMKGVITDRRPISNHWIRHFHL